jgi:hypothetical protein
MRGPHEPAKRFPQKPDEACVVLLINEPPLRIGSEALSPGSHLNRGSLIR